jgi:hypothetical protein
MHSQFAWTVNKKMQKLLTKRAESFYRFVRLIASLLCRYFTEKSRKQRLGPYNWKIRWRFIYFSQKLRSEKYKFVCISPIHTFVNIPALIRKLSVFLSSRAGILTKVWIGDINIFIFSKIRCDTFALNNS